jgi:hypothetical protein
VHQIQFTRSLQTGERVYRIRISVEARPWFVAVCVCVLFLPKWKGGGGDLKSPPKNANKHERKRENDVSNSVPFLEAKKEQKFHVGRRRLRWWYSTWLVSSREKHRLINRRLTIVAAESHPSYFFHLPFSQSFDSEFKANWLKRELDCQII